MCGEYGLIPLKFRKITFSAPGPRKLAFRQKVSGYGPFTTEKPWFRSLYKCVVPMAECRGPRPVPKAESREKLRPQVIGST